MRRRFCINWCCMLQEKWAISRSSFDSWHGDLGVVVFDLGYVWCDVGVLRTWDVCLMLGGDTGGKKMIKAWYLVALALMWIIVGGQAEDG